MPQKSRYGSFFVFISIDNKIRYLKSEEMAYTTEFWGIRKKGKFTEKEKRLKTICRQAKNNADFRRLLEIWREEVSPKETVDDFYNRCYRKAMNMGILREPIRRRLNWFAELSPERQDNFKKDWVDVEHYPSLGSDLLKKYPEAGSVRNLQKAATEYCTPSLPDREELHRQHANAEKHNDPPSKSKIQQTEKLITERLASLIGRHALHDGINTLHQQIREEFSADLTNSGFNLDHERFLEITDKIVWTEGQNGALTALKEMIRLGMDINSHFCPHFPHIPLALAEEKVQELKGITTIVHPPQFVSHSATLRGIGRFAGEGIKGGEDFEFPSASFANPYPIEVRDPNNWQILLINGANLGLVYDPNIKENPIRRALSEAEHLGVEMVIITHPTDLDTKKVVGPSKVTRALISGIAFDDAGIKSIMDPTYVEEALRIIKDHPDDEVAVATKEEVLKDLMRGWATVSIIPQPGQSQGLPEYSGPIRFIFGPKEERLAAATAYWEIHYHNRRRWERAKAELGPATHAFRLQQKRVENLQGTLTRKQQVLRSTQNEDYRTVLEQEITALTQDMALQLEMLSRLKETHNQLAKLEARFRAMNVLDTEWVRFGRKALSFIGHLFEFPDETIPLDSEVVSLGTAHFQAGPHKIKFFIPDHMRVTDTLLDDYARRYGPEALRQEMADLTVVCHPYSLNFRETVREIDAGGNRDHKLIVVAPTCNDDGLIRQRISASSVERHHHPIERMAFSEQVSTGALLITCVNGHITAHPIPLKALARHERKMPLIHGKNALADKYLWGWLRTDEHIGSRNRVRMWLRSNGIRHGIGDAIGHLFRQAGYGSERTLPIHYIFMGDDPVQGQHFEGHRQPHQKEQRYHDVQANLVKLRELAKTAKGKKREELLDRIVHHALKQFDYRGVDWYQDQLICYLETQIEPNMDLFDSVLRGVEKKGIVFKGISEYGEEARFEENRYDRRDIGCITCGTGNHGQKTTDYHVAEGLLFEWGIRALFKSIPHWQGKEEYIRKYVHAPVYGNMFIGFGTMQAPGGYTWGLDLRGTPASGTRWGDTLLQAIRTKMRRGNTPRIFEKMTVVSNYGDKHFACAAVTGPWIEVMGPPSTETDSYAEHTGLPPNNTGGMFIGLPAEGPNAGPILFRPLMFKTLKDYIEGQSRQFDWEAFLPNAL